MRPAIQIECGIPIPSKSPGGYKYPWKKLKIKESFLVAVPPDEFDRTWNSLTSCASWASYKTGFKFTMRQIPGGIRVWRIL